MSMIKTVNDAIAVSKPHKAATIIRNRELGAENVGKDRKGGTSSVSFKQVKIPGRV